jgi:hypothetical protein
MVHNILFILEFKSSFQAEHIQVGFDSIALFEVAVRWDTFAVDYHGKLDWDKLVLGTPGLAFVKD